jgi:hypothetical protein
MDVSPTSSDLNRLIKPRNDGPMAYRASSIGSQYSTPLANILPCLPTNRSENVRIPGRLLIGQQNWRYGPGRYSRGVIKTRSGPVSSRPPLVSDSALSRLGNLISHRDRENFCSTEISEIKAQKVSVWRRLDRRLCTPASGYYARF